jgi:thioredoxin reductase (NADPH)
MIYDCAIIGAGPAGIVASIQLRRAGFNIILFEKDNVGGLLKNANKIENYIGFPDGITGRDLISLFQKQLNTFGIIPIRQNVIKVIKDSLFEVYTESDCFKSRTVIIATGTKPKNLKIPGEEELNNKKVFYEVSDLPLTKIKKKVLIIGGGDIAFDYALNLFEHGQNPVIIMRSKTNCLSLLEKRAVENKIPFTYVSKILQIVDDGKNVKVKCEEKIFDTDLVLIAAGREPLLPHLELKNKNGLYFAGDVINGNYRQVHIAAGDALRTAMEISQNLKTK